MSSYVLTYFRLTCVPSRGHRTLREKKMSAIIIKVYTEREKLICFFVTLLVRRNNYYKL